ncbi:hypothetical protein QI305_12230 [Staphylococcus saprophyticus]|nr:hypothetical protein [Staphylococcus saprophyticus]
MMRIINDLKKNRFINKLARSIDNTNEYKQGYTITSLTRKTKFDINGSRLEHQLVIEKQLSEEKHIYFYDLKKVVTVPINLDASKMTIEKIEYDFEKLKAFLNSSNVKRSILTKSRDSIIEYPTIFASKGRVTVTGGLEVDYIYPIVKQNNPDSPISDEDLNNHIRNSKKATELLENDHNFAKASSNVN